MLDICHNYACKLRYEYNPSKCGIIVFKETKREQVNYNRMWRSGPCELLETNSYVHLGIEYSRSMSTEVNVTNACCKLRGTLLGLVYSGIHEDGLHPTTSLKMYNCIVVPKALYGCELWDKVTQSDILKLEKAHRFCLKSVQSIPKRSRTVITLSLLGAKPIEYEIDKRKLIFLGQLCRHSVDHLSRDIFDFRLVKFVNNSEWFLL